MGMAFNIVGMFIAIYAIDKYGLQVSIENYVTWHWNETEKVGGEESGSGKELGRQKGGKTAEQDRETERKADNSKRKVRGDGTPVKLISSTHVMLVPFPFYLDPSVSFVCKGNQIQIEASPLWLIPDRGKMTRIQILCYKIHFKTLKHTLFWAESSLHLDFYTVREIIKYSAI